MEDAVSVLPAALADKPVVARLLQLCLHDLSEWTSLQIGLDRSFEYPWLDLYRTSPRRHPCMIRQANVAVGFARVRKKRGR
jgi:predicted acetyltransferase